MKEQFEKALKWAKELDVNGCVTGSGLLGYIPDANQDIDIFVYDEGSFNRVLYKMEYDKMFQIIEPLERWKFKEWEENQKIPYKLGLVTVKFKYNLAIDINVILKKDKKSAFDVISSFDLDIICKAYDLKTKQFLDLSENDGKTAHWNKWNTSFYSEDVWTINRLLRQFQRCIKYHKRGYNTDLLVEKYIELLDRLLDYKNVFNSQKFDERLESIKANGKALKELLNLWLKNHEFTDEEMELLIEKTREL